MGLMEFQENFQMGQNHRQSCRSKSSICDPRRALVCAAREGAAESLLSEAAQEMLRNTTELDYMTHIVFRMYENKRWGASLLTRTNKCTDAMAGLLLNEKFPYCVLLYRQKHRWHGGLW